MSARWRSDISAEHREYSYVLRTYVTVNGLRHFVRCLSLARLFPLYVFPLDGVHVRWKLTLIYLLRNFSFHYALFYYIAGYISRSFFYIRFIDSRISGVCVWCGHERPLSSSSVTRMECNVSLSHTTHTLSPRTAKCIRLEMYAKICLDFFFASFFDIISHFGAAGTGCHFPVSK